MIDLLLAGILQCVIIPDIDEFSMCIDNLIVEVNEMVLEYNMSLEGANLEMY